jgi:DNA-binding NarL/FixJ family response regulator
MMEKPCRIVLAEDHAILREGLKALLSAEPSMEIVCEAEDGREALRCVASHTPDLVLIDLAMPKMNGLEAIREIRRHHGETKIVVLTVHRSEEYVHAALEAGADGYVLKDSTHAELVMAIRHVLSGRRYLGPGASEMVIEGYLEGRKSLGRRSVLDTLTQRERETLKLIAEGYRNREIADFLCISVKTVEKHRGSLMRKLDLHNSAALTAFAMEKGLLSR